MLGTCQRLSVLLSRRLPGRLAIALLPLLPLLLLGTLGCGANKRSFFGGDVTVKVYADPEINENSPVAVEMIVVYDKALLETLLAKTAGEWFRDREQVFKDHPGEKDLISLKRWEVVPGQSLQADDVSFGTGARGGIVFADYFSEGAHRARFEPHQSLMIHLQDKDLALKQPLEQP
jgi:type VI secretion system protein